LEMTRKAAGAFLVLRQIDEVMFGQHTLKPRVHAAAGIAARHRPGGVAVIAAFEGEEILSLAHALVQPELHRHLHGDLDRNRPGLRKEHTGQITWQECRKPARERERLFVGEAAEHDMRHERELALDRLPDIGVIIAVTGGPARRNPVDEVTSIRERDATTMRASHRRRRSRRLHLRVWQPHMRKPRLVPCGPCGSLISVFSRHWAFSVQSLHGTCLEAMRECVHLMNSRRPSSTSSSAAVYAARSSTRPG